MNRTACIALTVLALTVSCAMAPTAAPRVALLTATPNIETATVTETPTATFTSTANPTATPSGTYTPTANPTVLPTATITRIPPTGTPRPKSILFQRDFNNGQLDIVKASPDHWNVSQPGGTVVEIVPDPTNALDANGKPRGNVMKVTIKGDPVQHPDWGSNLWWRIGYPDWTYGYPVKLVRAPSGIQVDVYKPSDLYGIGLLSVHRQNKNNENDRTSVAGLEVYRDDNLVLVVRDGQGKDTRLNLKRGLFKSDQWNTLRLDFLTDGSVIPFVNGQNAYTNVTDLLKVPVDANYDAGFADGHAGLQSANQTENDGFKDGQYLLNDNFMVFEYR